jgi:hypothetical protein
MVDIIVVRTTTVIVNTVIAGSATTTAATGADTAIGNKRQLISLGSLVVDQAT